jgi:ubiquinone/menaquinone biosynthesis C-methylase UbiE
MDAARVKREQEESWTSVALGWMKWDEVLMQGAAPVSSRMLALARIKTGQRVLDVATGTGEPALAAAARVGPTGSVLGIDLCEPMLVFAREKAMRLGLRNVVFRRGDGEELDVPAESFDAVTCRCGLMFMPDGAACLARCRAALRPEGRLAVACWAEPSKNPWGTVPATIARRHLGLPAPSPSPPWTFALSDGDALPRLVADAGFRDLEVVEEQITWGAFGSADEAATCIVDVGGPIREMLDQASPDTRAAIEQEIRLGYGDFRTTGGVLLPGVARIVSATD